MKAFNTHIIFLLLLTSLIGCQSGNNLTLNDKITSSLAERENYFDRQLDMIQAEEAKLLKSNDKRERYEICHKIFNLSRSYKYEIAYKYSTEALNLALELGDDDLICQALASKLSTFTSGGLFTEAADLIASTNTSNVSDNVKREYFYNVVRYYSDQIDYANNSEYRNRYTDKLQSYTDSIIMLSKSKDYYYTYATSYNKSSKGEHQEAIDALLEFYKSTECSEHHDSIITFLLGLEYIALDENEKGIEYLEKSIRHDIKAAARENRSIKTMAEQLHERGDKLMSGQLINIAYDDAKFYNARHRNLEIATLLPIINRQRIETIRRQRNVLYTMLSLISALGLCALYAVVQARRRAKIIQRSKRTIEEQLHNISQMNSQLIEANNIKEYYVIESLHKKNSDLKQIEALLKKIDVKVKNKLYADLHSLYKDFNIKRERESFFGDFDQAFLKLFPNFIEEYNNLFESQDQIDIEQTNVLPPEVRIFALMRLGITDNERISQFLDLSINTIYTYKTKVKSRSIIPKDEFEQRILNIKLSR